jgi:hypothetical protein
MAIARSIALVCGAFSMIAGAFACNAVLGIDEASPEPASSNDSGAAHEGDAGDAGIFVAKDDCNDYCSDMALSCGALMNQEYLSTAVCNQICTFHSGYYDEQGLNQPVDVSPTSVMPETDTMYCRVWHAHAALEDPVVHCPHAGPLGAEMCGQNPCNDFCTMALNFCPGSYTDMNDCVQDCNPDGGYPGYPYLIGDASDLQDMGNTLNCRMYHLENFLFTNQAVHCSHITFDGGGVCSPTGADPN